MSVWHLRAVCTRTATTLAVVGGLTGCPKDAAVQAPADPVEPTTVSEQRDVDPHLEQGREYAAWFASQQLQQLFDRSTPAVQAALPVEAWGAAYEQVTAQFGAEQELQEDGVTQVQPDLIVYQRVALWEGSNTPLLMTIAMSADAHLAGFSITPRPQAAESAYLEYQTQTTMSLPLQSEWVVFWGGRTVEQNYHAAYADQRFAMDLLVVQGGKSSRTDGTSNEDYYAFGLPVLAPGDGVVVAVENGVPDNVPGEMNPTEAMGNHVIVDHGNGEFSFLAHVKQGTVQVSVGDAVSRGQQLGECGNSGNSSEPHIHYHLQTTAEFGHGEGLPVQFVDYVADGEAVERGEVQQGQVIAPRAE